MKKMSLDKIKQALDQLEADGMVRRTGEFREGAPVFALTDLGKSDPGRSGRKARRMIPPGPRVALSIPWPATPSGHVEYRLAGWSEGDDGQRVPIFSDPGGEIGIWLGGYAIQDHAGIWTFPDGETCDDAGLVAAFKRREAKH